MDKINKESIIVNAYGKINLTLEVLGLRADGYHEIRSIMQNIELHDILSFKENDDKSIRLTGSDDRLKYDSSNLIVKAASAIRNASGIEKGACIHLEKHIPIEAGLAGGSSDAAATLHGLNKLWGLNYSLGELIAIGATIGSDVPFCLVGGTALVEGRGEKVLSIKGPAEEKLLIVKPGFGASTKTIYEKFDSLESREPENFSIMMTGALETGVDFKRFMFNDLQRITTKLYPEVQQILDSMGKAVNYRMMSGSGPTCFCFGDNASIKLLYDTFKKIYKDVYITSLLYPKKPIFEKLHKN